MESNKAPPPMFNDGDTPQEPDASITLNDAPEVGDQQTMPPPVFSAPARKSSSAEAAKAAAIAAVKAAANATPAQRERMIMEAAAGEIHRQQMRQEEPTAAPRAAPGSYTPPDWSGDFQEEKSIAYGMEVMKNGTIIDTLDLSKQGHYTFGRTPDNDIILDHPSSSRLHAVVQYRGSDNAAFIYDPASTHGVYLNKKRIPPGQHIPLRVGDMLKFGESTRMFIFTGPTELMPEEGPNREQRKQAAMLKAMQARKDKDAAIAKAQMDKALKLGGGSGRPSHDEDDDDADLLTREIDWRHHEETHGLSEKQKKLAEKIRKKERRIQQLEKECENIRAKQGTEMNELSAGQASTLLRNEQNIESAMSEIEELEETLCDSIRDSIGQKQHAASAGGGKTKNNKRARDSDEDDDYDSDEDLVFDKTKSKRSRKSGKKTHNNTSKREEEVEDAASLYGKKEALTEETAKLKQQLDRELQLIQQHNTAPAADTGNINNEEDDSLEAFMSNVGAQLESDKVSSLRKQLADVEAQLSRTERLLRIADPDGLYKPGSAAANLAVERAKRAMDVARMRKEEEEKQRLKKEQEAKKKAQQMQYDDEDDEEPPVATLPTQQQNKNNTNINRIQGASEDDGTGGLQVRSKPSQQQQPKQEEGSPAVSNYEARRQHIAQALAATKTAANPNDTSTIIDNDDVNAKVLADLEVLRQAKRGVAAARETVEEESEADVAAWLAKREKEGQQGDGRTTLNDTLGY